MKKVSAFKSEGNYPQLKEKLSWEGIRQFPVKSADMTTRELRQLCVDFFRYSKTAQWIPNGTFDVVNSKTGKVDRTVEEGVVYGGLPYIGLASGNVYRMMDYYDEETGVMDTQTTGKRQKFFGNQCANGSLVGWSRVMNSAEYTWTPRMVETRGYLPVGDYVYDKTISEFTAEYNTSMVTEQNGEQGMYQSYAKLQLGDGIVQFTTAGHVVMISCDAVVKYNDDGTIDGKESYVTVIDQSGEPGEATNASGETYKYQLNVDAKWSFRRLFKGYYLPFTFAEFLGTHPVEETKCVFSHTGETITREQLDQSEVTCNYGMYDAYAIVTDAEGNEVLKMAARCLSAPQREIPFYLESEVYDNIYTWGNWEDLDKNADYKVDIVVQIGTGERPTIWSGKLLLS